MKQELHSAIAQGKMLPLAILNFLQISFMESLSHKQGERVICPFFSASQIISQASARPAPSFVFPAWRSPLQEALEPESKPSPIFGLVMGQRVDWAQKVTWLESAQQLLIPCLGGLQDVEILGLEGGLPPRLPFCLAAPCQPPLPDLMRCGRGAASRCSLPLSPG